MRRPPERPGPVEALAGLVVAAMLLTACGPVSSGPGPDARAPGATATTVPPTTATTPVTPTAVPPIVPGGTAPGAALIITAADEGRVLAVEAGATVIVTLSTGALWAQPSSSDPGVLQPVSGHTDARTGAAVATFVAARAGSARLTSSRRCRPAAGRQCAQYIALWSVTVTVR